MTQLDNSNVLFIATNGFQKDELFSPRETLMNEGATVHLASMDLDEISAGEGDDYTITPDMKFADVNVSDYDALVIPGGLANPDSLRADKDATQSGETICRRWQSHCLYLSRTMGTYQRRHRERSRNDSVSNNQR